MIMPERRHPFAFPHPRKNRDKGLGARDLGLGTRCWVLGAGNYLVHPKLHAVNNRMPIAAMISPTTYTIATLSESFSEGIT